MKPNYLKLSLRCLTSLACLTAIGSLLAAEGSGSSAEKQRELIQVLQSGAAPGDKGIACKKLAIYGNEQAVPVLAPLLADRELASWARIALEAIPGPAADEAFRNALTKLQGRLLIGTINSIGVRRDVLAVDLLGVKLRDPDAQVASAAAVALGKIGGPRPAKLLRPALDKAPPEVRSAVAEGCVRCAEHFLADHKASDAIKLYDAVVKAQVPKYRLLEAYRGAILARQDKGIPLLVEDLRSSDKAFFGMALRTARELPGTKATEAVNQEFHRASPERQPLILLALADRQDPAVMPTIIEAARSDNKGLKVTAISILEQLGDSSALPVLLAAAANPDRDVSQPAKTAIARLPGSEVDTELLRELPSSTGKPRQVLIEMATQRILSQALPTFVKSAQDPDAGIRSAAIQGIGLIGDQKQIPELVGLIQRAQNAADRTELESALLALSGRIGSGCVQDLIILTRSTEPEVRTVGLHALASVGGANALATVKSAVDDKDEVVRDEAVRTLSTWPNTWPDDEGVAEPLLNLMKSSTKPTYQVLAVRGYLQFLQRERKLNGSEKVDKVKEVLALNLRPEEKRLAIATLQQIHWPDALNVLAALAGEPAVADDACAAILDVAGNNTPGLSSEDRQKALKVVVEKSTDDGTRKKAEQALSKIQ